MKYILYKREHYIHYITRARAHTHIHIVCINNHNYKIKTYILNIDLFANNFFQNNNDNYKFNFINYIYSKSLK